MALGEFIAMSWAKEISRNSHELHVLQGDNLEH